MHDSQTVSGESPDRRSGRPKDPRTIEKQKWAQSSATDHGHGPRATAVRGELIVGTSRNCMTLDHLHEDSALVAHSCHPTKYSVCLHLALHPHQA